MFPVAGGTAPGGLTATHALSPPPAGFCTLSPPSTWPVPDRCSADPGGPQCPQAPRPAHPPLLYLAFGPHVPSL